MKQTAITPIIVLMGAAMIGLVLLQAFWIRNAINLKQDSINDAAFKALNIVADRVSKDDDVQNGYIGLNGYERRSMIKINDESIRDFQARIRRKSNLKIQELESFSKKPLEERISHTLLTKYVKEAVANRGLINNMDYDWAVYSEVGEKFIVKNGYFVIPGQSGGFEDLISSPYEVSLFSRDQVTDGKLMIFFPALSNILWSSVLNELLISLALVSVILFCFGYVIKVIFRQKKLSEIKTDFINNMTHEFKTPIATISLAADSITSPMILGNDEKVKRFADIIRQENKRMNSQVEKVLQMAMLDKDDLQLKLTDINLHDVINQAVSHLSLQVEKKDGKITPFLNATNPLIIGDLTHVSNMIHNLLDNANKYTPEKPEISVTTNNVASGVEVNITDNGIGMSKEVRKNIFNKFYREHTGDRHDVKGFGLGLSYVKRMMTAHKGQVDVKSEKGVGSSFILLFPHDLNK